MKDILLPTDFSKTSYNAITYALEFYKDTECCFHLMNNLYNADFIIYSNLNGVYKNNSLKGLQKLKKTILENFSNPKHQFELIPSFKMLYQEIKDRIAEKSIDMIVMGRSGINDGSELIFGSHTLHTIKVAKCPVLLVPRDYSYKKPEHILFPTDLKLDLAEYKLDTLKKITDKFHSKVHLLNVSFGNELTKQQESSKDSILDYFNPENCNFQRVGRDSVVDALYEYRKGNPVELLVMVKNKHTFIEKLLFSSVLNEVAGNIKLPFLVLPSENYIKHEADVMPD